MKKRTIWFTALLVLLVVILTSFVYPIVTTLTVYTYDQKKELLNVLQRPLEVLAIEQARTLDPNYSWIQYPEALPSEIENFIRESALSSQTSYSTNLATDSNLAYVVTYKGKTYEHFWPQDYDQLSRQDTILDITFTAGQERVTFSGKYNTSSMLNSYALFNKENKVMVPSVLIPADSAATEFYYYLVLPEGFSIHFYIPSKLEPNGGLIASTAASMDYNSVWFCLTGGGFVLFAYVLFWNKEVEKDSFLFRKFIRLKAITAWSFLLLAGLGLTIGVFTITQFTSSGELREYLYSLGMRFSQLNWFVPFICLGVWAGCYFLYTFLFMYVKYIFGFGLGRYFLEDTFTSHLLRRSETTLHDTLKAPLESWTWGRLLPVVVGVLLFFYTTVGGSTLHFGLPAGLVVLGVDTALLIFLARKAYTVIHQDYLTTLVAASELVEGNFSEIQPRQTGAFQRLYDALMAVKSGFQTALKDGLASQNMKTQLISNVSHDLKTPVTGIKSYAELISMADSLEQVQEYSHRLINYTDRLNALITDLFDVARANSGDIQLNPIRLNLSELIVQVEAEWHDVMEKLNLQIVLDLPSEAFSYLDADKTMRIIDNLMGNVYKYAMPGTRVFLTLQEISGQYVLVFKNISKTPLDFKPDEITERFVRGDKSRHEPGSGLGLAIVKSFMEVQKGSCTIEIDGDVFKAILVFPKAEDDKAVPAQLPRLQTPGAEDPLFQATLPREG